MAIATEPLSIAQQISSEERWESLKAFGFPKHYVSPNGRVKNNKNKVTKPRYLEDGSYFVRLNYYTKYSNIPISELVLTIFGEPKPSIHHLIEHIDGNPENDSISNLKWILPWSEEPFVDDTKEFWRRMDTIGYPNYCISSFGNLKNATNNRHMVTNINEEGYFVASIINSEGKNLKPYVHTLMALTFIGPRPSDQHSVDHMNRDRKDNKVGNLRWATREEQNQNRTYKKNRPGISVYQYDLDMNFIKKWDSMSQANETFGYNKKYMKSVCVGK
jgi:hypothetical protein